MQTLLLSTCAVVSPNLQFTFDFSSRLSQIAHYRLAILKFPIHRLRVNRKELFFFFCCTRSIWRFPGWGSNWSYSCRPAPESQQHQIRAASANYTIAHRNARSLTHLVLLSAAISGRIFFFFFMQGKDLQFPPGKILAQVGGSQSDTVENTQPLVVNLDSDGGSITL